MLQNNTIWLLLLVGIGLRGFHVNASLMISSLLEVFGITNCAYSSKKYWVQSTDISLISHDTSRHFYYQVWDHTCEPGWVSLVSDVKKHDWLVLCLLFGLDTSCPCMCMQWFHSSVWFFFFKKGCQWWERHFFLYLSNSWILYQFSYYSMIPVTVHFLNDCKWGVRSPFLSLIPLTLSCFMFCFAYSCFRSSMAYSCAACSELHSHCPKGKSLQIVMFCHCTDLHVKIWILFYVYLC